MAEATGGMVRDRRRTQRLVAAVVASILGLSASGCTDTSGESDGPDGVSSSDSTSAGTDETTAPDDLPVIDPLSVELGPVCRQEAVLKDAQPYPGDFEEVRGYMALANVQFPDLTANERNLYSPIGLNEDWAVPPDTRGWATVNTLICVDVVPDSEYVRFECSGPVDNGGEATWEIWGSELQIRVIDPSSGELVAEEDPFDSAELLPTLRCGNPPIELKAGEHGYLADHPPGYYMADRVGQFLRSLDR